MDSGSITPGDSVSQVPIKSTRILQPSIRPSHYPEEILWRFDDCKSDPEVAMTDKNSSRPRMRKAIRHEDGSLLNNQEWIGILATANDIKTDLTALPVKGSSTRGINSMTYFRNHYLKEWNVAIDRLEHLEPLLVLCSAHWKAQHILGLVLRRKSGLGGGDGDSENEESDEGEGEVMKTLSTSRKRAASSSTVVAKKKKKTSLGKSDTSMFFS